MKPTCSLKGDPVALHRNASVRLGAREEMCAFDSMPSQIAIADLSEKARQFRAVAPLLMWSLSSPQQPLETEAFSNRLIAADYSGCWLEMQSRQLIVKLESLWHPAIQEYQR